MIFKGLYTSQQHKWLSLEIKLNGRIDMLIKKGREEQQKYQNLASVKKDYEKIQIDYMHLKKYEKIAFISF